MNYYPYGPIPIPRHEGRIARDKESLNSFWLDANKFEKDLLEKDLSEAVGDLSEAVGCYIFSIRAGKGILPWYVGLAEKQTFRKECFTAHKLVKYNECINHRKGTPVLTFVPKVTKTNRHSKPGKNGHKDIQFLETMLIGACLMRNPELMNIKDTKLLREMVVPGLLNTPKGRVACFNGILGK